jgi:hypothetical protein
MSFSSSIGPIFLSKCFHSSSIISSGTIVRRTARKEARPGKTAIQQSSAPKATDRGKLNDRMARTLDQRDGWYRAPEHSQHRGSGAIDGGASEDTSRVKVAAEALRRRLYRSERDSHRTADRPQSHRHSSPVVSHGGRTREFRTSNSSRNQGAERHDSQKLDEVVIGFAAVERDLAATTLRPSCASTTWIAEWSGSSGAELDRGLDPAGCGPHRSPS